MGIVQKERERERPGCYECTMSRILREREREKERERPRCVVTRVP